MQGLINFNEINELIRLYEQLKCEINSLDNLNINPQKIARIKSLTFELDNKLLSLKTILISTALLYAGNIQKK